MKCTLEATQTSREMTRYLISFDDGAMTFPEEDLPDVAEAARAVVQEAKDSGVWVFGGGLHSHEEVSVVATDGTVTDGPESMAYVGGFSVVDVPSREEALAWGGYRVRPAPPRLFVVKLVRQRARRPATRVAVPFRPVVRSGARATDAHVR